VAGNARMTRNAASGMAAGEASVPSATLGAGGNRKSRNNQSDYGQTSHEDIVRPFCRCALTLS
jgi:hypothetical protein